MRGIDYAWHGGLNVAAMKTAGVQFVCRYLSHDGGKNLGLNEKNALNSSGIAVVVVWESTANRALQGHAAGVADAAEARKQADSLGMQGVPIYFAADWDVTEGQQAAVDAYLDGAASVIGHARTGLYGGYWPVKRAFDHGKIAYGWQTYAWSGGHWDGRAQLRQTKNDVKVAGLSCDWDESTHSDFGQWPRPGAAPPHPPAPKPAHAQLSLHTPRMSGADVRLCQERLNTHGAGLKTDGVFGPLTQTAVKNFQRGSHLTVDGIVGPLTWAALLR